MGGQGQHSRTPPFMMTMAEHAHRPSRAPPPSISLSVRDAPPPPMPRSRRAQCCLRHGPSCAPSLRSTPGARAL